VSDRIDFGGKPWRAIPQEILRDGRLSAQAKGGLVTLLSHNEGWVRSCIAILQKQNHRCGEKQARAIMKELVDVGYAQRIQNRRKDGTFSTGFVVTVVQGSEPGVSPGAVSRHAVPRGAVKGHTVVEALEVDPPEVEPTALAAVAAETPSVRANALATVYYNVQPLCNFPAVAGICRKALKAGHGMTEIAEALLRLAEEGRGVTTETLRVELEGLPERKTKVPDRGAEILQQAYEEGQRAGA
jgi:hypothetical protein